MNASRATPEHVAALTILDAPQSGPWKHVRWSDVQTGAAQRVFFPQKVNQGPLNLCGPAAIVNAMAERNPLEYASFVRDIFTSGKVNGVELASDLLNNKVAEPMDAVDWMVLSGMRDSENGIFDYEGTSNENFSAITTPSEMKFWMEKNLHCKKTESFNSYLWGDLANAQKVNSLMAAHGQNIIVMMLIDADTFQGQPDLVPEPNHWIRLRSLISLGEIVCFEYYSWGQNSQARLSQSAFERTLCEFTVGAMDDRISL